MTVWAAENLYKYLMHLDSSPAQLSQRKQVKGDNCLSPAYPTSKTLYAYRQYTYIHLPVLQEQGAVVGSACVQSVEFTH